MDQLIQTIQQRTGLDAEQARGAAQAAADFFKDKLPDPIAGQIDGILSGQGSDADSAMEKIGSAFNR